MLTGRFFPVLEKRVMSANDRRHVSEPKLEGATPAGVRNVTFVLTASKKAFLILVDSVGAPLPLRNIKRVANGVRKYSFGIASACLVPHFLF